MQRATIDRRDFLRRGLAGVSAAATYPIFLGKTAAAAGEAGPGGNDRILVVVQLSGGNDGLSTVVPYADPAYGRARATTRLGEKDVLRIDERLGLHPNLAELKGLFDDGKMAIVQGVSYPNPTRSHFEAMDIWHAGDREYVRQGTGWLGRAIDSACGNAHLPLLSLNVGGNPPRALMGKSKPVSFANPQGYGWRGGRREAEAFMELNRAGKAEPAGTAPLGELDFLRRVASDAQSSSDSIRRAVQAYRPSGEYPAGNRLAADLRMVAGLIASKLPTRVYYVSLGGFDTHANQRPVHDNLMRTISAGIAAFLRDLKAQGLEERVLVLTFSEFGRRVKENASRGTDHGVAAPMFLFGRHLRGGVHGRHPSLEKLQNGDLAMTSDFRQVYASVLEGWLGISSQEVLGKRWEPMELLRGQAKPRAI